MRARSDCGTRLRTIASQVAQLGNSGRPLRILGTIGSSAGSGTSCAVNIPERRRGDKNRGAALSQLSDLLCDQTAEAVTDDDRLLIEGVDDAEGIGDIVVDGHVSDAGRSVAELVATAGRDATPPVAAERQHPVRKRLVAGERSMDEEEQRPVGRSCSPERGEPCNIRR